MDSAAPRFLRLLLGNLGGGTKGREQIIVVVFLLQGLTEAGESALGGEALGLLIFLIGLRHAAGSGGGSGGIFGFCLWQRRWGKK